MHHYDQSFVDGNFYYPQQSAYQPYQVPLSPASRRPEVTIPTIPIVEAEPDTGERRSTDQGWKVGFLLTSLLAALVALTAGAKGVPEVLYRGVNFNGLICGVDGPVVDRPYTYYPLSATSKRPSLLLKEPQCVAACPGIADVGKTLDVPMSQLERDASSSVVVQYRVNTPLYATRLVADYLCVPLDARLKAAVLGAYQGLGRQMRFGLGTAAHAWPAIFLSVMVCAVLGSAVLVSLVGQASWLPSLLAAPSIPVLMFTIACYSFWFAIAGKVPNIYFKFFPATFSVSALLGVVFLFGSVIAACLVAVNWPIYGVVANTTKVTSHAFWSSNVLPVSSGLATLTATFAGLAFDVLRRIVASASVSAVEESLAINENGGVSVVPLHRAVRFLAPGVVLGCVVWIAASIWIVFTLINLNRFVVAYTGATWYFSDPATCGCDQRDVGWCPALIALEIGLKHHLGSMALGALGLPLTVVKSAFAFLSRRLNPQYFDVDAMEVPPGVPDASNHATDTMARALDALVDPIADVVDSTTTAVWTEIALQCHNLNGGIRTSRARLLCKGPRVMPSIASPYVGTAGIQSLTMACAAALGAYFMGFLLLTNVSDFDMRQLARDSGIRTTHKAFFDFTSPDSARFVSSPAYAAGIGAIVAFLCVLMIAETIEVISDSMFYCYILESDGYGETYHGTRIGNVVDHPCNMRYAPAGVKQFLSEVLEVEEMEDNAYVN